MTNDARRDSDKKNDGKASEGRRSEIDHRTREKADSLAGREPRATDAAKTNSPAESLPRLSSQEHFQRLDRISEHNAMKHLPNFDPTRELQLEDLEIRLSPVAFLRRRDHAGLDRGTVKLVEHSLEARGIAGPDDLRREGVEDTWGIWERKSE